LLTAAAGDAARATVPAAPSPALRKERLEIFGEVIASSMVFFDLGEMFVGFGVY